MAYTTIDKPTDYFNTVLYTGNGSTNAITGVGFQPDFIWCKARSIAYDHRVFNSISGVGKYNDTGNTGGDSSDVNSITAFGTDGFTLGSEAGGNGSSQTFVSWNWLASNTTASNTDGSITSTVSANTTAGFSIVSYTGTGSSATVGHGLGVAPKLTIFKRRNNTSSWRVMTTIIDGTHDILYLNVTDAKTNASESAPTSSILNLGTGNEVNGSSDTYIAYCFAEKKGYSKFGSYTGNGNANGPMIYLGFKPAFFLIKNTNDGTDDWHIMDNKREGYNPQNDILQPNLSDAEGSSTRVDFLSNGVKINSSSAFINGSGEKIIYMAFAENPFVTSTGIPTTAR